MKQLHSKIPLGDRLMLAAGLILFVILPFGVYGLDQLAVANREMEEVTRENNLRVEQARIMQDILRERTISIYAIFIADDPSSQQEEILKLKNLDIAFMAARDKLGGMTSSAEESRILGRLRDLAAKGQPSVVKAIDNLLAGKIAAARALISKDIIAAQKQMALEMNSLLAQQRVGAEQAVAEAAQAYGSARLLMLLLGAVAVSLLIAIAFIAIRSTREQERLLQHQALYDSLTGLPNRELFADRLQQAILISRREKQPFALIAMDLNRFKEINDTLGHHAGDQVLRMVADRTRACLRESDTVARMGGDEFTILLATASDSDGAIAASRKILKALEAPLEIAGQKIETGASLGIAMFPEHGEDPAVLMREADAAMYLAKQTHGGYKVYSTDLGKGADDRLALQGDLRHAIANHELVLHFQPKIDFTANRVHGVEALVRWQHPKHGLLAPDKFIPLAEQTGLIKPLTYQVLRSALQQCEEWQRAGLDLSMSVNISAINIQDPEFPAQVAALLKEFTVSPAHLELEVTETAVMAEPVRAVACIRKLSALGLQIAIDDFGTGYSSMSYLKDLLVAKIKIDKSFVKDMAVNHNDAVIVRSTVELGHNLGLKVVAEGVETEAVWDRLKALGCDDAQGYYMSRPLPLDKFAEWLQQSPWGLKTTSN